MGYGVASADNTDGKEEGCKRGDFHSSSVSSAQSAVDFSLACHLGSGADHRIACFTSGSRDPLRYQAASPAAVATTQTNPNLSQEMVTVKLRYKKPDGDKSELTERSFVDNGSKFENAAPDLKFAAAVAEFGMILRDSQYKGKGTIGAVIEWAQEGKGRDAAGYRAGFIELARKTQTLRLREG